MKKGFIEMIEDGQVTVIYDDFSKEIFDEKLFPANITIDMNVTIQDGKIIDVTPPSEELRQKIEEITKKIFVPFNERKARNKK